MRIGFLELISGNSPSTEALYDHVKSIESYLHRLLNSRQDFCVHTPQHGLPDLSDLYRKLPGSAQEIQQAVKNCIEEFEPRLNRVRVQVQDFNPYDFYLQLNVDGRLKNNQNTQWQVFLTSEGRVRVQGVY